MAINIVNRLNDYSDATIITLLFYNLDLTSSLVVLNCYIVT